MDSAQEDSLYRIIRKLLDEYPSLRLPENQQKLVWCVWVKLGYATEYSMSYSKYLDAPTDSTILRIKRALFVEHPPYKFSDKQVCPKKTD